MAKTWLDSIEKQKRIDLKEQRDKQTDAQTKNNRLLPRRGDQ